MSVEPRIFLLAGASLLALSSGVAWSQQAAEPILLDEIVLTASSDASVQADGSWDSLGHWLCPQPW